LWGYSLKLRPYIWWPFISYNWLFLWDYTFYKWGFLSTYNWYLDVFGAITARKNIELHQQNTLDDSKKTWDGKPQKRSNELKNLRPAPPNDPVIQAGNGKFMKIQGLTPESTNN